MEGDSGRLARVIIGLQLVALGLLCAFAVWVAVVTVQQGARQSAEAQASAERAVQQIQDIRATFGAFFRYSTCVTQIPLDQRTPETLDPCFDFLREAGIPIGIADIGPSPTPSPSPSIVGPGPPVSPSPTETQTGADSPRPSPTPQPSPSNRDRRHPHGPQCPHAHHPPPCGQAVGRRR